MGMFLPEIAELAAGAGEGGAAAGAAEGAGGASGLMQNHPFMMGNLMGHAMAGGGEGGAPSTGTIPAGPQSVAPVGVVGSSTYGDDEVGVATKNRGENSDPDQQSSSGDSQEEFGDSPEQLKDVGEESGAGKSPDAVGPLQDQHGAYSELQGTAVNAFHSNLPLVLEFAFSDKSGAEHPILSALDELLENAFPGYKDLAPEDADTTETGVQPEDDDNPTEKLEGELGHDMDDDNPKEASTGHHIAHMAGYCPECWGYVDVLGRCASCKVADVPAAVGLGQQTDPNAMMTPQTMMGAPSCPMCGQSHVAGTPCPTPSGQQEAADAVAPMMGGMPVQNTLTPMPQAQPQRVVTHRVAEQMWGPLNKEGQCDHCYNVRPTKPTPVKGGLTENWCDDCRRPPAGGGYGNGSAPTHPSGHQFGQDIGGNDANYKRPFGAKTAEFNPEPLDQPEHIEKRHNESYEDGERPEHGWYEDWPGPEKDSHPWADESGQPLEEGQDYDMHSSGYAIPDHITVTSVTPNKLTYRIKAGDVEYSDTLTKDDVYKNGYTFKSAEKGAGDVGMQTPPPKRQSLELEHPIRPGQDSGAQVDDLSTPPTKMSHDLPDDDPSHGGDMCVHCGGKIRDGACRECGRQPAMDEHPNTTLPDWGKEMNRQRTEDHGQRDPDTYLGSYKGDEPEARSWVWDAGPGQGVDVDPHTMAKIAGKDFSPREQREFINEDGEARNLHRLDLAGSHYEFDTEDSLW